jgi:hypothetical protein
LNIFDSKYNNMKKYLLIILLIFFTKQFYLAQNVGINTTGAVPAASAMLDIVSTDKGLLVPRFALSSIIVAAPVVAPAVSLIVYNTATAGVAPNNVLPGFYFWDGSKWVAFAGSGGNDWALLGNAGTVAGTNFLGTTDAQHLDFRTNNTARMRIMNSTYPTVGIGTTFPVTNLSGNSAVVHVHDGGTSVGSQLILSTHSTADAQRTGVINFAASQATNDRRAASIESYLTATSTTNVSGDLRFFTNNVNSFTEKMRILSNGNVGIGTTTPGYRLDLNTGTFAFGNGNVRTETRNDAGLQGNAGAQSGFFETSAPTNYPAGATSWWHLIDTRHSNNTNNYALQISGSFFDQKLYFRKTNNNAAEPWTEILSSANNPVSVSLTNDYTVNTAAYTTIPAMSVTFVATKSTALVQLTSSGFAYTNSMASVFFRVFNSTTGTSVGGTNTHMQSYDDTRGTITPWSCSFSKNITGLTPGTSYTLIVQAQRSGIWGTLDAVIYASTNPDSHHVTLTVFP